MTRKTTGNEMTMKTGNNCSKLPKRVLATLLVAGAALCAVGEDEKCPVSANVRGHENIEWSRSYAYGLTDETRDLPRVLLIGDSICNSYQEGVRERLKGKMNVTYWVSSYCVTSPAYLPLLTIYLDEAKYDVIHFNNGLHSLKTPTDAWAKGLEAALELVRKKQPDAKIVWCSSTPLANDAKTAKCRELNTAAARVVSELGGIDTDDLFSLCDPLDRATNWCDEYHFHLDAITRQSDQVAASVLSQRETNNPRASAAATASGGTARPVPDANLLERMRSGVDVIGIVHFTVNTFTDREWGYGSESPDDFNPTDFSADQIVKACRDGGIKGLVVVAKHHDGFCLWPTKTTEHNVSKSRWMDGKGDYVGAMEKACRRYGVKFGVYCSPWDRNNAAYATPEYVKTYHAQVEELNDGRYGEIFEMWFDGANGGDGYYGGAWEKRSIGEACEYYRMAELQARVRELQPRVCFFGGDGGFTWPGNESGEVPPESGGTRDDGTFRIYEADFPLRPGWFYHESQDGYSRSGEFLTKIYLRTVGNGAIMDIGISPDKRGRLTDEDVGCLKRFSEIREAFFSKPVADESSPFNVIVMAEDIEHGERVDEWRVLLDGRELAKGGKIGTKRIRVLDAPVSGRELKLEITQGDARADEIEVELFLADEGLVRKVMASEEPKRPPATFELKGVLTSRKPGELVYMMKNPATVSSLVVSPDSESPGGTPVAFRLAYSVDGVNWSEDETEYRLDNVAANPVPQDVALAKSVKVKYLRLRSVRTLKDGAAVHLKGVEFVPCSATSVKSHVSAESNGHRIVARDSWCGFDRRVFEFLGSEAWIVEPKAEAKGRPWAWIMEWPDAFANRTGSIALLKAGYHVVTLRSGCYENGKFVSRPGNMNDARLRESRDFQKYLVDELHFAPKVNLIGMSWGGFYSVRYAGTYPEAVSRIYLDAPLLDFSTLAEKESWGLSVKYGIDIATYVGKDDPRQPVNMYEPSAKAGIPILLVFGGADTIVPPNENCIRFADAFKAAGGNIEIVARELYGHHPHGLDVDEQQKFVDFFNGK